VREYHQGKILKREYLQVGKILENVYLQVDKNLKEEFFFKW
jgi:hypothetical protein